MDNQLVGHTLCNHLGTKSAKFPEVKPTPAHRAEALVISQEALLKWKSQIFDYQQKVRESLLPQQTALFDIAPKHYDPEQIDPLLLRLGSSLVLTQIPFNNRLVS